MSDSDWDDIERDPCGCVTKIRRDVSGKVLSQDLDHCVAHALSWAGKLLHHAGEKMAAILGKESNKDETGS